MKRTVLLSAVLAAVVLAAQAQAGFIIESRSTGQNYSLFSTTGGWATSTGNVTAPGTTPGIGSMYSSTGTFFGPNRQAIFSFTPSVTSAYDIELAWASTAGQTDTAVVLYTGAPYGGETDPWGNAGPGAVVSRTTMDMYYTGVGVWNLAFDDVVLTAGTTYKVGIYGGHAQALPANRVAAGAAQFTAVPEPVTLAMLAFGGLLLRRRRA